MVFLARASTRPALVVSTESVWDWVAEVLLSLFGHRCGLRLLSATRALRVDCRVKLIGASLEEGGVTISETSEDNGVAPRGDSQTVLV